MGEGRGARVKERQGSREKGEKEKRKRSRKRVERGRDRRKSKRERRERDGRRRGMRRGEDGEIWKERGEMEIWRGEMREIERRESEMRERSREGDWGKDSGYARGGRYKGRKELEGEERGKPPKCSLSPLSPSL